MKLVPRPKPVVQVNVKLWRLEKAINSDLLHSEKYKDQLQAIHEELLRRKAA